MTPDLSTLFTPDGVHELRVPNAGRQGTISGYFDNPAALLAAALEVDAQGPPGVYFTLNPVNPALLARCANRHAAYTKTGHTTSDHDVARRRWVPVDLDPIRPANIPSTDAEHQAAQALAGAIVAHLRGLSWPEPVGMDSGNGAYLLYPTDLPNDDASTALVKGFLTALAARFTDGVVKVDTSMHNTSRIIRVPGTTNRKGSGSPDRPHRGAGITFVPKVLVPVTAEQLASFASSASTASTASTAATAPAGTPVVDAFMSPGGYGGVDVEGFVARHLPDAKLRPKPDGGLLWEIPVCPWNPEHDRGEAYVGRKPDGTAFAGCQHDSCQERRWADLREHFEPSVSGVSGAPPSDTSEWAVLLTQERNRQWVRREAGRQLDAAERPPVAVPEILTLAQRLARPREPVPWRIEGWQPAGSRGVLAAQFKAGKTTVVGNLVRVLVDGGEFLGRGRVHPVVGTVAVLDFEMGEFQIDGWLDDQGIAAAERVVVVPLRGRAGAFDILSEPGRARWVKLLRERGVAYLVLDCLRPVLDALGLDEHHDAGRFLVAFDRLLSEAGIGEALVVHHMGHSGERSRGDSRIRDWPDVEWRLVRQDPDDPASPRYISAFGRDVDQPEAELAYEASSRHLWVVGGSRAGAADRAALASIMGVLRGEPGQSGNQIEAALDGMCTRNAVRRALAAGVEAGALARTRGVRNAWLYRIVEGVDFEPTSTVGDDQAGAAYKNSVRRSSPGGGELTEVSSPVTASDAPMETVDQNGHTGQNDGAAEGAVAAGDGDKALRGQNASSPHLAATSGELGKVSSPTPIRRRTSEQLASRETPTPCYPASGELDGHHAARPPMPHRPGCRCTDPTQPCRW
jgi:hypothetical protein